MEEEPVNVAPPEPSTPIAVEVWAGHDRCLPPDPDGPAWERAVHAANLTAATDARRRLARRFPDLDAILAAGWRSFPFALVGDGGLAVACAGLLDELLRDHHLGPDRLKVSKGPAADLHPTTMLDLGYGITRPATMPLALLVAAGGGFAVLGVEEQRRDLGAWVEDFDRVAGQLCRIDLVVTGTGTGSLTDPGTSALVIAVLDGRAELHLVAGEGHAVPVEPVELAPGDAHLVPAGWGTRLVGLGGPAQAARLALPRLTWLHLASAAGVEAVMWPLLRADIPEDRDAPIVSYAGSVFDTPGGIAAALATMADDDAAARALARHRGSTGARWSSDLAPAVAAFGVEGDGGPTTQRVRCPLPGGVQVGPPQDDGSVVWFARGRKLRLVPAAALALAPMLDGRPHETDVSASSEAGRLARTAISRGLLAAEAET